MSWFNKNRTGNSPEYESMRHGMSAKGMKSKGKLIVDLDGTIANSKFREESAWRHSRDAEDKREEFEKRLNNPKLVKTDRPIKGTAEELKKLDKKHDVTYVTGRLQKMSRSTSIWLKEHGYPKGRVRYRPPGETVTDHKIKALGEIKEPVMMIGDGYSDRKASRTNRIPIARVRKNHPWNIEKIERKLERVSR